MASILKHLFPYLTIHIFTEISRALPISPLERKANINWSTICRIDSIPNSLISKIMSLLPQTQFSKNYKSFIKKANYKLRTLSFQSHSICYLAYLATNQLMVIIWGFSDPYIGIKCHILIQQLQLFGIPFQQIFANK